MTVPDAVGNPDLNLRHVPPSVAIRRRQGCVRTVGAAALVAAGVLVAAVAPAGAQRTGEPTDGRQCTLRWEPRTDSTESRSVQSPEGRAGTFTHYVWNGMRWTCGGSTITADSAVQREAAGRVEMYGHVHYRDSVRVLDSRELTYLRGRELVVAREDVHLTLLASGSTLEGPYVEFYRPGSGREERTVATRRPHMTVYPPGDTTGGDTAESRDEREPYQVDADTVIIHGEVETEALGDVVVNRTEIRATGRRALFDNRRGRGKLWGAPVASGQEFRLSGDTIRLATDRGEVRMIHGLGDGHLTGEDLDVRGEEVTARLDGRQVEMLWSHGGPDPRAVSAGRELTGDSLRFAFRDGRLDTAVAVGHAAAVDVDSAAAAVDVDSATAAVGVDSAVAANVDSAAAARRDTSGSPAPDTVMTEPRDTAEAAPAAAVREPPDLETRRNWVVGDTVVAVFEPADTAASVGTGAPAGSDVPPDTADAQGGAAIDSASERSRRVRMRQLTARGNARSFYLIARDTLEGRRARNYMIGEEITVTFRDGEPHRVQGVRAIGVYLEPDEGRGAPPPTAPEGRPRRRPPPSDTASGRRNGGG